MPHTVRNASADDFETIYQFVSSLQNWNFTWGKLEKIFERNVANSDNNYLSASDGIVPVGCISCHIQSLLHHEDKWQKFKRCLFCPVTGAVVLVEY